MASIPQKKTSNLDPIVDTSLTDLDIMPIVSAGITWKMSLTNLALKLGRMFLPAGVTVPFVTWLAQINKSHIVSVSDYGAIGDGVTDDSAAIQAAINSGRSVFIPEGVFLLNGPRQPAYRPISSLVSDSLLVVPSGLHIFGAGYNSVLKVANGYSAAGDYRVFGAGAIVTNDVEMSYFRIDGNGSNNLVIDSGANVRRAYTISLLTGTRVKIHDLWIHDQPGRNNILLLNDSAPAVFDFTHTDVYNNKIWNSGGAIVGNENQNDHSSISVNGDHIDIFNNDLWNDIQPNAFATPAKTIAAIETHFRNGFVRNNRIHNYTAGINTGGNTGISPNIQILNNKITGATSNAINFWTNYAADRCRIAGNTIEIDNMTYSGGTGIYQSPSAAAAVEPLRDLVVEDNEIYATNPAAGGITWYGMYFCALDGFSIRRNRLKNIQANGIVLSADAINVLSIRNGSVDDNTLIDCGMIAARPHAIVVSNSFLDNREVANITGKGNRIIRTPAATILSSRGIRIVGSASSPGGYINNVHFEIPKTEGIQRAQRADLLQSTNFRDVGYLPRVIPHARATDPTEGMWQNGQEYVVHTDPASAGFFGKIPTSNGSAVSGVWATSTAYTLGQWIRTSTNKVLRCIQAGTSDPTTEPAPATLGSLVVDGTVQWLYEDTAIAIFKTFGVIS